MSFLAADTPDATLAAALAFIDSFDGSSAAAPALGPRFSGSDRGDGRPAAASEVEDQAAASSGSSASSPPQLASAGGGDSAEEERSAAGSGSDGSSEGLWGLRAAEGDEKRRPKKTKKSTAQASKRLREKKKREMAALMEEAAGLETRLAALQRRATIAVDSPALGDDDSDAYIVATTAGAARTRLLAICPADGEASWMDVAVREARHLERSEALNTELRRALEDQSKLADALRGFVSGHPAAMVRWRVGAVILLRDALGSLTCFCDDGSPRCRLWTSSDGCTLAEGSIRRSRTSSRTSSCRSVACTSTRTRCSSRKERTQCPRQCGPDGTTAGT